MTLSLAIPDEVASALGDSEPAVAARVQADLAVVYYEAGLISAGKATEMSGLRRADFETLMSQRKVVRNYGLSDWAADSRQAAF